METTVEINSLRLRACHGVFEQERRVGNIFEVTVHLTYPYRTGSDDIADTINYAEVIEIIKREMALPSMLIEHVASRIKDAVTSRWPAVTSGIIRVEKCHPPIAAELQSAAVSLKW